MKIGLVPQLLIHEAHPSQSTPSLPLGLLSLAGAVDRRAHEVEILDLTLVVRSGILTYDASFVQASARLLLSRRLDVVGFSTFSGLYHLTLKIAAELKALSPSTTIVFGGPQASFCDRETLQSFPVDVVVRGEGELTFVELLQALQEGRSLEGVAGLSVRVGGAILRAPDRPLIQDLDQLPMPALELVPMRAYPRVSIECTRGCPFRCVYCATSSFWERKVRRKSVERVCTEMSRIAEHHGSQSISFVDDTFSIDRPWAMRLCATLVERGFKGSWSCSTRIDLVDDELLEAMSRAGCSIVFYGIESGSERMQRQIGKNIRIGAVIENLRRTAARGISVTASLMIGFPDETEEDLAATLRLRNEIQRIFPEKQSIQTHVLAPDLNTEITRANMDRLKYDGFHSDQSGGDLATFDLELIARHRELSISSYYIEPKHLSREFIKLTSCFLTAAQLLCYWSSLYVMLRDEDPLRLARTWMQFFAASPEAEPTPLLKRAVANAARFFGVLFQGQDIPPPVRELYAHEQQLMRIKGGMLRYAEMRRRAAQDKALFVRTYEYDPRETIALIRQDLDRVASQEKKPTRIDYFHQGP